MELDRTQRRRRRPLAHELRVLVAAIAVALPGVAVALLLVWLGDFSARLRWTLTILLPVVAWATVTALMYRVVFPLRTVSNLLAALREGDFTMRARGGRDDDALGEIMQEVNLLGDLLRRRRFNTLEAGAVFRGLIAEIDLAVIAFDADNRLHWINPRGQRLLGRALDDLLGHTADDLHLGELLRGAAPRVEELTIGGETAHWEVRRGSFREGGFPFTFVVLSDLTRPLREQEREAWLRLVSVLRHEVNNSLAPISSIAETLVRLLDRTPRPDDWERDLREALAVVSERSAALARFMSSYSKLTRLPPPRRSSVNVASWVRRVATMETRLPIRIELGPEMTLHADCDQLDQLLINLLNNAVDAALETGGGVCVGWSRASGPGQSFELWVDDDGAGLLSAENLFVPFFTTKPYGTGIGLVLCRQIAEAHGGSLTLENRAGGRGCRARFVLPNRATAGVPVSR